MHPEGTWPTSSRPILLWGTFTPDLATPAASLDLGLVIDSLLRSFAYDVSLLVLNIRL